MPELPFWLNGNKFSGTKIHAGKDSTTNKEIEPQSGESGGPGVGAQTDTGAADGPGK